MKSTILKQAFIVATAFFGIAITVFTAGSVPVFAAEAPFALKVTSIVEHPALDAVRKGVQDELATQGFTEGRDFTWEFQSAQGNTAMASQIARKFADETPSVIVAIGTPSAQAIVSAVRGKTPVVFSAVTDPVGARLVADLKQPGQNVTGASDVLPLQKHLDLIREMLPEAKKIGILFNPSEANSVAVVSEMQELGKKMGFTIVEGAAPDSNSVQAAARSLVGKVDAFYVPTDNTVVSAMEIAARVAHENKIPLLVSDNDSVPRGALASLGISYYELGRVTGSIVIKILKGEKAGNVPVAFLENNILMLNADTAEKIGLKVPESILKRAEIVGK